MFVGCCSLLAVFFSGVRFLVVWCLMFVTCCCFYLLVGVRAECSIAL